MEMTTQLLLDDCKIADYIPRTLSWKVVNALHIYISNFDFIWSLHVLCFQAKATASRMTNAPRAAQVDYTWQLNNWEQRDRQRQRDISITPTPGWITDWGKPFRSPSSQPNDFTFDVINFMSRLPQTLTAEGNSLQCVHRESLASLSYTYQ